MSMMMNDNIDRTKYNKKNTLNALMARKFFTPDWQDLNEQQYNLVFLWDSHMKNFPLHNSTLTFARYLGRAHTVEKNFSMRVNGVYPFVIQDDSATTKHLQKSAVRGELYAVSPLLMSKLDINCVNGEEMERNKLYVQAYEQPSVMKDGKGPIVQAWVYTHKLDLWNKVTTGWHYGISACEKSIWAWEWKNRHKPTHH